MPDDRTTAGWVADAIPPIPFADLRGELQDLLRARYDRLGYLGGFFQHMAHQPAALAAFIELTEALKSALPPGVTEAVALGVSAQCGNRYELNQHQQLARALGFADDWIWAAATGEGFDAVAAPPEVLARSLAVAIGRSDGRECAAELAAAAAELDPPALVAVLLLIGRYRAHSAIANALQLLPPVGSVIEGP